MVIYDYATSNFQLTYTNTINISHRCPCPCPPCHPSQLSHCCHHHLQSSLHCRRYYHCHLPLLSLRCKDVRVLGEFEGGEDLPPDKGTTTSGIGFECPHLDLTQTELTRTNKGGNQGDSSALFFQQGMGCFKYKRACT